MSRHHTSQSNGIWDVRRKIRIPSLVHEADALAVIRALEALPGIKTVVPNVSRHRLEVRYDSSTLDYQSLLMLLEQQGFQPANNWWARLKGNWYQFTDSNTRENARLPPPACCNKAPKKR